MLREADRDSPAAEKVGLLGPVLGGLTMVHLLDHSEDPTDYGHPMANFQGCQLGYHWILQIGHLGYFGHKASINEQNYPMMDFGPHPYVQKNHVVSFISCYIPIYSWLDPHELTDFGFQNVIRNRASRKLPPHLRELRHLQGVAWPSIYRSTDAMNILNIWFSIGIFF